jgi:hypothetical protein
MRGRPRNITLPKLINNDLMPTKALSNLIFDKHRHYYDFYHKTGEIVNFHHDVQQELLNEYRRLKDEYYHFNNNCKVCVIDFLNTIYRWYDNIQA